MKYARFVFITVLLTSLFSAVASADTTTITNHLVISEIQTGSAASASQEFVELYNPTDQPVMLDNWQIQYRPAGATSNWGSRTSGGLHGNIAAHGFYLIAPTTYLPNADNTFSSGMAQGGGSIRLTDAGSNVIDLVGWGTAVESEGPVATVPAAGQSLERLPGATNESGGNWVDTDNNAADFTVRANPDPQSTASAPESPGDVGAAPVSGPSNPTTGSSDPATITTATSSPLVLNELFVDPASPLTDSKDEFIEIYNPSGTAVNLAGYVLKTGSNFHDTYTIPAMTIAAGGYQALYSASTKLSLTNSGGAAQLLDPSGNLVDQSAVYDGSITGASFGRFGDDWQWSLTLTPGAANVYSAPTAAETAAAAKAAKTKTSSTKKASAKKTIKASKVKAPKGAKSAAGKTLAYSAQPSGLAAKWLIIGLAGLTIGYAIYEFRYDLQNYYHGARSKYRAWRAAR